LTNAHAQSLPRRRCCGAKATQLGKKFVTQ
jgi:hypothetical protein